MSPVDTSSDATFTSRSGSATSRGNVRAQNEDAVLELPSAGLWVVADGMGGHEAGGLASGLIVQRLSTLRRAEKLSMLLDEVESRLIAVNEQLYGRFLVQGSTSGSTVAALAAFGPYCLSIWAGDSRVYCLRKEGLTQVTRDHSAVQALVEEGALDPQDAALHNAANVITRAVGGDEELYLDLELRALQHGDRYLLCSDGLYKELSEADIASGLGREDPERASRHLIQQALSGECSDNASAVVVEFSRGWHSAAEGERSADEDAARQLRILAGEYSEGRLTHEAYRRRRTELLDSLPADHADAGLAVTQPRRRQPSRELKPPAGHASLPARLRNAIGRLRPPWRA